MSNNPKNEESPAIGAGASSSENNAEQLNSKKYYTTSDVDLSTYHARRFPYDPYLLSKLKSAIPVEGRIWDPDNKCWYFGLDHIAQADRLIHRYSAKDALTGITWDIAWNTLHLRETAPASVIEAAAAALLAEAADDQAKKIRIEISARICREW